MAESYLATYLNDHLGGSQAALELLEHLERTHAGTPVAAFASELWAEVAADRRELEALMERLQVTPSGARKAAAWLAAKVADLKMRLDDSASGPLRLLEILEGLSLGIEGKRLLWRSLSAAAARSPSLAGMAYERLERRAGEQRLAVEAVRVEAARAALASAFSEPSGSAGR